MARIKSWIKHLLGKPSIEEDYHIQIDDLRLFTSDQTNIRAEKALPGTNKLEPILKLIPPPVNPDLVDFPDPDSERDYGPCQIAEWSLVFKTSKQFKCARLSEKLLSRYEEFESPMYYVRTTEGHVTYMNCSDSPSFGMELIAAWSLRDKDESDKNKILAGAKALETTLTNIQEGFQSPKISAKGLKKQLEKAYQISIVEPKTITVVAYHPDGEFWNGVEIWVLLHQLGLKWGDMDCFQWADPTYQTDYLIWVEVDDGDLGYALPELISAGKQNFRAIHFSFDISRSPAPEHVLGQLELMVALCQKELSCNIRAFLDEKPVSSFEELRQGVLQAEKYLDSLGVKPGSGSVCQLI